MMPCRVSAEFSIVPQSKNLIPIRSEICEPIDPFKACGLSSVEDYWCSCWLLRAISECFSYLQTTASQNPAARLASI